MTIKSDAFSRMRQRITFQTQSTSSDGGGGTTLSWTNGSTVWAEVKPIDRAASGEKFVAGQLQSTISHIITTRYFSGITTNIRVSYDSRVFNIRSAINVNERGEMLRLFVEEGVGS
jgi:SPP1 family predicted phage head-tail adaptor